jgi:hypothetical protein
MEKEPLVTSPAAYPTKPAMWWSELRIFSPQILGWLL